MGASRFALAALAVLFGLFGFFTPLSIAGAHTSLALAVVLLLLHPESRSRTVDFFRSHPLSAPLIAWCLVSILAVVFAMDRGESVVKLKKLALIPLLPLGALPVVRKSLRPILGVLIASTAIIAAWGLIAHFRAGGGLEERVRGISGHYMTIAGILMVVSIVILGELLAALKDPHPRRILFLSGSGLLTVAALLGTYTRGSWIGFAFGTLFLLRKRRLALGLLAVGAVLVYALGPPSGRDRFHSMFDPSHTHNVERIETWKYGARLVLQRPLTGAGLVIPRHLMEEGTFVTDAGVTLVPHSHMHMAYLQIAVAMGIPGLAVFLWLVIGLFRLGRRAARAPLRNLWEEGLVGAFPAALVALLVNGLFEWNFGDSEVLGLLYFLVGGVLGIERGSEV